MDHPRIRGKKFNLFRSSSPNIGSPPHTREKVKEKRLIRFILRITPAYAGKRKAER
ncbi:hypothetical protein HMPREF3187_01270 [Aerococcus christensenii]|uniref:Uncharacterized protein n=1 Tax=Aerococcus christensenii TaxID=87541 RepID=A0A133XV29_9LACT|nr:hypothetical protein HMPREF3187_01270 [Aerococcus christensenii]